MDRRGCTSAASKATGGCGSGGWPGAAAEREGGEFAYGLGSLCLAVYNGGLQQLAKRQARSGKFNESLIKLSYNVAPGSRIRPPGIKCHINLTNDYQTLTKW